MSLRMTMAELEAREEAAGGPNDYATQCLEKARASMKRVDELCSTVAAAAGKPSSGEDVSSALQLVEILPSVVSHVDAASRETNDRDRKNEERARELISQCRAQLNGLSEQQHKLSASPTELVEMLQKLTKTVQRGEAAAAAQHVDTAQILVRCTHVVDVVAESSLWVRCVDNQDFVALAKQCCDQVSEVQECLFKTLEDSTKLVREYVEVTNTGLQQLQSNLAKKVRPAVATYSA